MTYEEQAARLQVEEIAEVLAARAHLSSRNSILESDVKRLEWQVDYLQRQLYGKKSERRVPEPSPDQKHLFEMEENRREDDLKEIKVESHTRKQRKKVSDDDEDAPEGTFPAHLYYYLLDLLSRIDQTGLTAKDLTPKNWKAKFFQEAVPDKAQNVLA